MNKLIQIIMIFLMALIPMLATAQGDAPTQPYGPQGDWSVGTATSGDDTGVIRDSDNDGDRDAWALLKPIYEAFKAGDWSLLAGLILSALVAIARMVGFTKKIPHQYDKYVAVASAVLITIATGLQQHKSFFDIVTTGVAVGFTSIGAWEFLFAPIKRKIQTGKSELPTTPIVPRKPRIDI